MGKAQYHEKCQLDTSLDGTAHDADFGAGDDYHGTYGTLTFADGVAAVDVDGLEGPRSEAVPFTIP